MADFAVPIPVTVIAELLGIPPERLTDFKRWSGMSRSLSFEELMLFAIVLLVAGNETTMNLIGNTVDLLLERPADLDAVCCKPRLIPGLVEEALRFVSPIQMLPHIALRDTEVAGQPIEKGAYVLVLFASANRDSRQFPRGDEFELRRNPTDHVAFGFGIHYCLGAALARLERPGCNGGAVLSPCQPASRTWADRVPRRRDSSRGADRP